MLTLPVAARALAGAADAASLIGLARTCGFGGTPAPLDADARRALGLPATIRSARVLEGKGVLRALCIDVRAGTMSRDALATIAIRLQRRSPFALWMLLATEHGGPHVGISTALLSPRPHASLLLAHRDRVLDSDAETLRALSGACAGVDVLVHARWCEILGREAITRRFFRALEHTVESLAQSISRDVRSDDARTLAILTSTRLLFLSFLEAKGWLDGDAGFLRRSWDECMAGRRQYHRNVLLPLCFGTLNTPRTQRAPAARAFGAIPFLNGGLFTRTPLERKHRRALFPDATLGTLVSDLLGRWRFTVRENDMTQSEAAVDPEMLGRAFESLMASRERRASGSYYTPRVLVARAFDAALDAALAGTPYADSLTNVRVHGEGSGSAACALAERLSELRFLDPACGSGAFLVHALEETAALRSRAGDPKDGAALRRDILSRQLFGVDREPIAVWLCELRLWLSVVVETDVRDPAAVPPLPNLDANVRVGDALAGDGFVPGESRGRNASLTRVRERYARATGARKRTLARVLATAERDAAIAAIDHRLATTAIARRDIVTALRGRDLFGDRVRPDASMRERVRVLRAAARELRDARRVLARGGAVPFDFAAQFADVGARGGFDVVIGNPPWVRLHRIPQRERAALRARFVTFREAGWRAGAEAAGAASGFAAQVDLAALFVERAVALTHPHGTIALLVPAKLWRSLAGGGVRHLLASSTQITDLEDWSEAQATFDAAVYPSLVVARRGSRDARVTISMVEHHRDRALRWDVAPRLLPLDDSQGAPWLWLPADPRRGFDRVRALGAPLADRADLRPRLGVKCGYNDAFIVPREDGPLPVERHLLRPLLRGEHVASWRVDARAEHIIFPHDRHLVPLRELPPLARKWMQRFRPQLVARSDHRGHLPWWSLFRLDAADHTRPRVVWADMSTVPRAAVLAAGEDVVPLNSCYVSIARTLDEAHALATWLNSPIAAAWLSALAEPARGGFRRMLGWTVSLLPLPRDWDRAVSLLAPLGAAAQAGTTPAADAVLDRCLDALGATPHEIEPLITWGHR